MLAKSNDLIKLPEYIHTSQTLSTIYFFKNNSSRKREDVHLLLLTQILKPPAQTSPHLGFSFLKNANRRFLFKGLQALYRVSTQCFIIRLDCPGPFHKIVAVSNEKFDYILKHRVWQHCINIAHQSDLNRIEQNFGFNSSNVSSNNYAEYQTDK